MKYRLTIKEVWKRLTCVTVAVFSTITGHAVVSPTRPPRPQQGSATLHRSGHAVNNAPRMRWASLHRVGTITSPFTRGRSPVSTCKNPATPCGYKRGARAHIQGTLTTLEYKARPHTHSRVASTTLSTTQSRDLGLSPLSQPACTPLLQALSGARQYRLRHSH